MGQAAMIPAEPLLDPTRPPAGFEVSEQRGDVRQPEGLPRLTGIKRGRGVATVILNGRAVAVGESIDGYELTFIAADHVKLSRQGAELELPLLPNVKKALRKGH
jgi:hypothetical protein